MIYEGIPLALYNFQQQYSVEPINDIKRTLEKYLRRDLPILAYSCNYLHESFQCGWNFKYLKFRLHIVIVTESLRMSIWKRLDDKKTCETFTQDKEIAFHRKRLNLIEMFTDRMFRVERLEFNWFSPKNQYCWRWAMSNIHLKCFQSLSAEKNSRVWAEPKINMYTLRECSDIILCFAILRLYR